ncbi:unnamed protein product [Ectocarpus sp. 4 AP-2014]
MEKERRVSDFLGRSMVVGCLAIGVAVLAFGGSPKITPKFGENKEFGSTTKELDDRDNDLATRDKTSLDLAVELLGKQESLTAMATVLQEQHKIAGMTDSVKIPSGAPRIQYWYVEREAVISKACDRLGVGNSTSDSSDEPRMAGLAGPSGVGKSTAAAMVVGRADVRAHFHKGLLWLQVGQGAKQRLPEIMTRLAGMVYETVMLKQCRPLRKAGSANDPEDGAAYIREVVDENSRRFLVVADDVWEREVLEELKRAGVMWVLYTTRQDTLLPEQAPQRLDEMLPNEAELVLRRAADLDDNARLPAAANDLMNRCEFVVLDLAMVGRWGLVRGRRDDEKVWRMALNRIVEAQKGGGDEKALSWRAAVLRAGLEELASDNPQNKELYLSLAVIPRGLSFPGEVAAVLLYGDDLSAQDLEAAGRVMTTLERWSILTVEDGGLHRVHDEHAEFIQGRLAANQDARVTTLSRWRGYASSVRALFAFSSVELVKIWDEVERVGGEDVSLRPYDAALDATDPSSAEYAGILDKTADFHLERQDWFECRAKYSILLPAEENVLGMDHLDVAITLHKFGVCASMVGRMEQAEELFRRALEIREVKLGVDHPDVAFTLHEFGACASEAGRMEEAEELLRRALAIREERLGVAHPDVARTVNELGVCAFKVGRMEEAEELLRRALEIREVKLGVDHPDVARTLHELGVCASKVGRMEEAEELLRRALEIREVKLGVDHPDVASTLHSLGVCACKVGRMEEADELLRRAACDPGGKVGRRSPGRGTHSESPRGLRLQGREDEGRRGVVSTSACDPGGKAGRRSPECGIHAA